jgi:hypothetical protein
MTVHGLRIQGEAGRVDGTRRMLQHKSQRVARMAATTWDGLGSGFSGFTRAVHGPRYRYEVSARVLKPATARKQVPTAD